MEGFVVDPRKSTPADFEQGMRDVKLVFDINHTMPYTEEYDNLCVINADDRDIISQALIEMSNKYNVANQFQVANKIDEVRRRFLDNEIKEYVKTNLNYHIKVKLNDYGKQIHYDYWKDICRDANVQYKLEVDDEGYSSFQIHEFMNLFGEYAHLGAKPFLETNDVLIERSEK